MRLLDKIKLSEGEKILHVVKHWFGLLLPHFIFCFLIIIFDFFLMYYLFLQGLWGVLAFIAILVVAVGYTGRLIFLWKRNIMVLTNKRIIDWEQLGFFEQTIQELSYVDIENVEAKHKGLFGKMFKFGNLSFKIKNEEYPFVLYKVKFPVRAAEAARKLLSSPTLSVGAALVEKMNQQDEGVGALLEQVKKMPLSDKKNFYKEFKKILRADLEAAINKRLDED
ncbi:PH domain-containing protein [Candidatus Falkowbacteria bacterium]|nr:PH domain-containing protein [Candidatus Falkowbacteria bacterium]